jgi:hypothetical protein
MQLLRPTDHSSRDAWATFAREVQILKLLNHESVLGLAGIMVDAAGNLVGALSPRVPHTLQGAWCEEPHLELAQHRRVLLDVCCALEFLGARRILFAKIEVADVSLTHTLLAKVQCYGLRPGGESQDEAAVVAGFARILTAATKAVRGLALDTGMVTFAKKCTNGTIANLCDLMLEAQQVRLGAGGHLKLTCEMAVSC